MIRKITVQCTACKRQRFLAPRDAANVRTFCPECGNLEQLPKPILNERIEALEAALRACVQYHVKAAADCRAISAVNQNNDLGNDSLTAAIDHDIAAEDIAEIAYAALEGQDK